MAVPEFVRSLLETVVTFVVLIVLAILAFFVTVFVVSTGAQLAGANPSDDFVVLSASLLVISALLGGLPVQRSSGGEKSQQEDTQGFH